MRLLGIATDPTAGGSTYDDLAPDPVDFVDPDEFVPVTTAQVDKGLQTLARTDEVRGVRGNTPISSFASQPKLTFSARAYPAITKRLARSALGGAVTATGVSPAAVTSEFSSIDSGNLPALIVHVIREGQRDRLSGLAVANFEMSFAVDQEGTIAAECWALYHEPDATPGSGLPVASYTDSVDTFKLRDAEAYVNDASTPIDDLAGFSVKFDNGLIDDFQSRFSAGRNVRAILVDGQSSRVWYPSRNKLGSQEVTGSIDFGDVKPDQDLLNLIARSEKVEFEITAGPAGTTPPAKEALRITLYSLVLTGGAGADDLKREGDIRSSYDFTAYVDPTVGRDIDVEYVGATALT